MHSFAPVVLTSFTMNTINLTPEQFAQYEAILNEYDRFRTLSREERKDLIIRIAASTYIDLLSDWAFKHVFGHNEKNLMLLLDNNLNIYLCELPRLASKPGKSLTPVEVWFDILQNMRNFASKPEIYGSKYDPIFESSLQSPIPAEERIQYFRAMLNDDIRSYLTDEDRQEIAEEFYAKGIQQGIEQVARKLKADGVSTQTISAATGLSPEAIDAL